MKKRKERQKSGGAVLARILLCMMTVWILTGCGSDRTHWRDVIREEEGQEKEGREEENYDLRDEEKIGGKKATESEIGRASCRDRVYVLV